MKKLGIKDVREYLSRGCLIRVNTMPFRIPNKPDIGLYGWTEDALPILIGSVSSPTFYNLLDSHEITRKKSEISYDIYY